MLAASRIREEVDPAANIILGATFDKSLEGQVRVSVVATGLDQGAGATAETEAPSEEVVTLTKRIAELNSGAKQERAAKPQAGGQAASPKAADSSKASAPQGGWKPPADVTIEARPPQSPAQPSGQSPDKGQEKGAGKAAAAFVPQPPSLARPAPRRMPEAADFPDVVQRELAARAGSDTPAQEAGIRAQKKKIGFFERLTGLGRKEDKAEAGERQEPDMAAKAKTMPARRPEVVASTREQAQAGEAAKPAAAVRAGQPPMPSQPPVKVTKARLARGNAAAAGASPQDKSDQDAEDLEIPEFLRRQAN